MIASIRGEVLVRGKGHIVVETGGVGYHLTVSTETLKAVPSIGQDVFLHAVQVVRDDSISLFGFATESERDLFSLLITVSGVGPKVAISALSTTTPRQLVKALEAGDAGRFQAVPGIGKRTAERIILDLQDKADRVVDASPAADWAVGDDARDLARAGLMGLGYDSAEADRLLEQVQGDGAEELIAAALREAASARSGSR